MKKFALALTLFLCLAMGAAEAGQKMKIGISTPTADHGWTGGIVWWAQKAVGDFSKKYPNAEFLLVTADNPAKQISDIEDLVMQGIKALIVLPHEPAPLAPTLNQIKADGVFMVVVDRVIQELERDVYVAGDNPGLGRVSGEFLAREMGSAPCEIVVMTGIPCDVDTLRVEAFNEVMAKNPNIKVLESQPANWSTQKGLELMENFLQKYPKIDAVWCQDDDVLKGVMQAYEESGRKDVKLVLGGAGSKDIIKMIIDGDPLVRGTATYPPKMIYDGVELAAEHLLSGKAIDKVVIAPSIMVTKTNAKDYYYPDSPF
ncbi:MAG: ABC transporter substrate-binding protein [Planctomycetota bacterium]|jgi:ribose transport system substrate-binding protein|nr:ABC transporter substrate-binding protein [Planctomycetota bacterium]